MLKVIFIYFIYYYYFFNFQIYFDVTKDVVHESFGLPISPKELLVKLDPPKSKDDPAQNYSTGQFDFVVDYEQKKFK